jgi:hypothetical protein
MEQRELGHLGTRHIGANYMKGTKDIGPGGIRLKGWKRVNGERDEPRSFSTDAQAWQLVRILQEFSRDYDSVIKGQLDIEGLQEIIDNIRAAKDRSAREVESFMAHGGPSIT